MATNIVFESLLGFYSPMLAALKRVIPLVRYPVACCGVIHSTGKNSKINPLKETIVKNPGPKDQVFQGKIKYTVQSEN